MGNLKKKKKSRHQIFTYFDEEEKICDREGDLELQSIFEANFRNNLLYFHGEENISAKGCIKIEPKLIFSSQSIF